MGALASDTLQHCLRSNHAPSLALVSPVLLRRFQTQEWFPHMCLQPHSLDSGSVMLVCTPGISIFQKCFRQHCCLTGLGACDWGDAWGFWQLKPLWMHFPLLPSRSWLCRCKLASGIQCGFHSHCHCMPVTTVCLTTPDPSPYPGRAGRQDDCNWHNWHWGNALSFFFKRT